jgi:plasmid maintenance system antidote protein VapI
MNDDDILYTRWGEMKKAFYEWHREVEEQKSSLVSEEKSLSINQVAKRLGRAHNTIKKMIKEKTLITTSDEKRVTEVSLNMYLQNNRKK